MSPDLPTGTVTFLFSDIEGSTRLLGELGVDRYATALATHRAVVRSACAASGGVEVDTAGDSFFLAFPTAVDALAAAASIGEGLAGGPIAVRIGIHTGNPVLTPGGYVGSDVHLGARIAAAGSGGQVLLSGASRAFVGDRELVDLGEHRLKDFATPVLIFQLGSARFPPLRTISNTNLPRPASSFVGRGTEVAEVAGLLSDRVRLLTLTGPGGSGKTRLAIEAAATLVPVFRAGVFWIGLASVRDPALVTETIGQTIGAKGGLADHIGEREMLLVIDNIEQVIAVAPELAALVEACPHLRLLITSRERLRVRGEREYPVSPLAESDAVTLFCELSRLAPSDEIASICRAFDHLPLAIELAAARAALLTPTQINERLASRLDLLKGGRDADPRQVTLRATIEWSYELLGPDEQRLFDHLAVFRGGATLDAAEQVSGADLDTLGSLVDKSLVRHVGDRFVMLETIREYAAERLDESCETDLLRRRHSDFFVALARDVREAAIREGPVAFGRLEPDDDNIRASLAWTVAIADRPRAFLSLRSLWAYWLARGRVEEGDRWARQLVTVSGHVDPMEEARGLVVAGELARFVGDPVRAIELKVAALDRLRGTDDDFYAATARDLALVLAGQGDIDAAERFANEALDIRTSLGSAGGLAHALFGVAHIEWNRGRTANAIRLMEQSVDLWAEAGDESSAASSLEQLADFLRRSGELAAARARLEQALSLSTKSGDLFTVAWCFRGLGSLLADEGDAGRAAQVWAATQVIADESGLSFAEMASDYDMKVQQVRDRLGPAEFERLWSEGAELRGADVERLALG
jgi:predicted ATPase